MNHRNCCPYCQGDRCRHFLGWTDDGRTYSWSADTGPFNIPEDAVIVKTGVSARVYQESGKSFSPRARLPEPSAN